MYPFIRTRINYLRYHHRHHIRASWCTKWSIQTLYIGLDYDLALKNHFSHRHLLGQHGVVCSNYKHFNFSMVLRSSFRTTYFLQNKMLFIFYVKDQRIFHGSLFYWPWNNSTHGILLFIFCFCIYFARWSWFIRKTPIALNNFIHRIYFLIFDVAV